MLNVLSAIAAVAVGIALVTPSTQAAELLVLGSQGNISGIRDLAAGFERASGHKVVASQERNVMEKVNANAPADVVTGNPPVIDDLISKGKVVGRQHYQEPWAHRGAQGTHQVPRRLPGRGSSGAWRGRDCAAADQRDPAG